MKKTLIKGIMMLLFICSFSQYTSADIAKNPTVQELVMQYSKEYGVSATRMMNTIKCENKALDTEAQSRLKYKKGNKWKKPAGSREQSYGLVQIHLPDHPTISKDEATDPDFSIKWMASEFKAGRAKSWSCYRILYG